MCVICDLSLRLSGEVDRREVQREREKERERGAERERDRKRENLVECV